MVGDRLRLLDDQTLIVTENTSRSLTRQVSSPVQETELPSNETPMKRPVQFEGEIKALLYSTLLYSHEALRQELDALPGYHRNVNNRCSEVRTRR